MMTEHAHQGVLRRTSPQTVLCSGTTRRQFVRLTVGGLLGAGSLSGLLAACGTAGTTASAPASGKSFGMSVAAGFGRRVFMT